MKGWAVCRFHGAKGGAPRGKRNGAWRHGMATNEVIAARREVAALVKESGKQIAAIRRLPQ